MPTRRTVELSWQELYRAAQIGVMRHIQSMQNGADAMYGAENGPAWQYNIVGAIGEFAVAKHLNVFWDGAMMDNFTDDVCGLQVRTRSESWHELIAHDRKDKGDDVFILAHVEYLPEVVIVGWAFGREIQRDKYYKDPAGGRPAYFYPQDELRDMSTIPLERNARVATA